MDQTRSIDLAVPASRAARAVAEAAELWGGSWEPSGDSGGRLVVPVLAGLRRGVLVGRVALEARGTEAVELTLVVEERHDRLNRPAVVILLVGAAGALGATLWPLFPRLLAVAPLAVVLAVSAWLLIVARLRTSGPEEFLELVATLAGRDAGGESPDRDS